MSSNNNLNLNIRTNASNSQKWIAAIVAGLLFLLLSSPIAYQFTNALFGAIGLNTTDGGRPTWGGLIIHSIIFVLLIRLIMA